MLDPILGYARDIPSMQFGDKPFLIVVNGLGRKKNALGPQITKASVTWSMSNVESYIILVSISCYEVLK